MPGASCCFLHVFGPPGHHPQAPPASGVEARLPPFQEAPGRAPRCHHHWSRQGGHRQGVEGPPQPQAVVDTSKCFQSHDHFKIHKQFPIS